MKKTCSFAMETVGESNTLVSPSHSSDRTSLDDSRRKFDELLKKDGSKSGHNSNCFDAFNSTVKTFAGAGTFALPWSIRQAGLLAGSLGIVILALLGLSLFLLSITIFKLLS